MALGTDAVWNSASYWSEPAERAFAIARRKARRQRLLARIAGRRAALMPFSEAMKRWGLLSQSEVRLRTVALGEIVGSVGKAHVFTRSFHPRSDSLRYRWKQAFANAHGLRGYEPIELYEAKGRYYVVDGHFRVSVAQALGNDTIQARVQRWV